MASEAGRISWTEVLEGHAIEVLEGHAIPIPVYVAV